MAQVGKKGGMAWGGGEANNCSWKAGPPSPSLSPLPSQGLLYPLDTVRTRLAVSAQGTYSGIYSTLHRIWAEEGFRALYRGITPNMIGILVSVGDSCNRFIPPSPEGGQGSIPWFAHLFHPCIIEEVFSSHSPHTPHTPHTAACPAVQPYAGVDIALFEIIKEELLDRYDGHPPHLSILGAGMASSTVAQVGGP